MMYMTPYTAARRNRNAMADRWAAPFGEDFFREFFGNPAELKFDVADQGDSYLLETDLPGVPRENMEITVDDGVLTIAVKKAESKEENGEGGNLRERRYAGMSRSFRLEGIEEEGIRAEYTDGVLKLTLPKKAEQPVPAARRIAIGDQK